MSEANESLNRTNELLEQLLEHERQKTVERQEMIESFRTRINFEMPTVEETASDAFKTGFSDLEADARMQKLTEQAEERLRDEIAFRDRLVAILDEQTAILTEIAAHLRR